MSIQLPELLSRYFDEGDPEASGCTGELFAADATVVDEGRTHRGSGAIAAWKREARAKYRYTAEPLSVWQEGAGTVVRARISGDFPGSPVELDHVFVVSGGRITSLEIHA